jgi:hypothetical protein
MPDNRPMIVSELDFDRIRSGLISFMQGRDEFKNIEYEGSTITQLINILAVTTHYNAWYANFIHSESNLQTAQLRDNAVNRAKSHGYIPRGWIAPKAVVTIDFGTTNPGITFLPKNTIFEAGTDTQRVQFINLQTYPITLHTDGEWEDHYVCENVDVFEGRLRTFSQEYSAQQDNPIFHITDTQVDATRFVVRVQASRNDADGYLTPWQRAKSIVTIDGDSKVYFHQEGAGGTYEIYFGDGVLGKALSPGNVVYIEYLVTNGPISNGLGLLDTETARSFELPAYSGAVVSVVESASGGSVPESVESIRFNVPRANQTQDRGCTAADYEGLIPSMYPNIGSSHVWGGEENEPKQYGKVFIAVKPIFGYTLSDAEKTTIARELRQTKSITGITPVVVDADVIYMLIRSKVYYDTKATTLTSNSVRTLVQSRVKNFSTQNLEVFGKDFLYSNLLSWITATNNSIVSNETTVRMQKRLEPTGYPESYSILFNNPIQQSSTQSITTSPFQYWVVSRKRYLSAFLRDDPSTSKIGLYFIDPNGSTQLLNGEVGTINYTTGSIQLVGFNPYNVRDGILRVTAIPANQNIYATKNKILVIDAVDTYQESIDIGVYDSNLFN